MVAFLSHSFVARTPGKTTRLFLVAAVLPICFLALLPLLALARDAVTSPPADAIGLGHDGIARIRGTLLLVGGEGGSEPKTGQSGNNPHLC